MTAIQQFLCNCAALSELCPRNGWIDTDTLRYTIIDQTETEWILDVDFEEIVMEASGCVVERNHCRGRVRLCAGPDGAIHSLEIL